MKTLKFFSILLFPFFAFGATHTTIVQNTSGSNLLIYYSSCNYIRINNNLNMICDPINNITLNEKTSNYQNPIIINGNFSHSLQNEIHIIKIIDTINHNSKYFNQNECANYTGTSGKSVTDFLTISNLIDNQNIFICTQGNKK